LQKTNWRAKSGIKDGEVKDFSVKGSFTVKGLEEFEDLMQEKDGKSFKGT
jgi:hypothetical protein